MAKLNKLFKSQEKQQKDLTKERDEQLSPVAHKIIKVIAEAVLPLGGELHAHDNPKFVGVTKEVLGIMLDNGVKYVDSTFLFQLILQPFDNTREIVMKSLGESLTRAETKLFGKGYREVTLRDLDKIIKGY